MSKNTQTGNKNYVEYLPFTLVNDFDNFLKDNPGFKADELETLVSRCLKFRDTIIEEEEDRVEFVDFITVGLPSLRENQSHAYSLITGIWDGLDSCEKKMKKEFLKVVSDLSLPIASIELEKKFVIVSYMAMVKNFIRDLIQEVKNRKKY